MWQDDGSDAIQSTDDSPEFKVAAGAPAGTPVNARFKSPLQSGQYFEVEIQSLPENSGGFIGVVTEASFKKGWGCRGLFFGGNLSDGGGLVRANFGKKLEEGMKVGMLVEFEGDNVALACFQNGKNLGRAFVARRRNTSAEVYPAVMAFGAGSRFTIAFPDSPPTSVPAHPAVRRWIMCKLSAGPELEEIPLDEKMRSSRPSLQVDSSSPRTFSLYCKVVNNLSVQATAGEGEELTSAGGVRSTRMMGPEGAMEVERLVAAGLGELQRWDVKEESLTLFAASAQMEFVPADESQVMPSELELP